MAATPADAQVIMELYDFAANPNCVRRAIGSQWNSIRKLRTS